MRMSLYYNYSPLKEVSDKSWINVCCFWMKQYFTIKETSIFINMLLKISTVSAPKVEIGDLLTSGVESLEILSLAHIFWRKTYWKSISPSFKEDFMPLLNIIPVYKYLRNRIWFIHDDNPIHHITNIHAFANVQYPECWIGIGELVA